VDAIGTQQYGVTPGFFSSAMPSAAVDDDGLRLGETSSTIGLTDATTRLRLRLRLRLRQAVAKGERRDTHGCGRLNQLP